MIESFRSQPDPGHPSVDTDAIRIFLVDDNEDDAMIAHAMLTRVQGITFDVEWVPTFRQGLEKLKEDAHDICILDY